MGNFVTLTKIEFENILPNTFKIIEVENCKEFVYQTNTVTENVAVRIYSTVDVRTGITRGHGEDAIRVVFWNTSTDRPIGKGKRINRVEKNTTIKDRLKARIDEFLSTSMKQKAENKKTMNDFDYVKAILEANTWSDFATSLLDQLNQRGSLSEKKLDYVLGEKNPKGKNTFETLAKRDKNFEQNFINRNAEEEVEEEIFEYDTPLPMQLKKEGVIDNSNCVYCKNNKNNFCVIAEAVIESNEEIECSEFTPINDDDPDGTSVDENTVIDQANTAFELATTKDYEYHTYNFETFNPVQSEVLPHTKENKNMIIGANTSAGKTICAELLIDATLNKDEKIIYLSPLKSLTQEKYDDWSIRYKDKNLVILTGDYTLTEKTKNELQEADIIVMTSEMMDSRTRKMKKEGNTWINKVGLVVVDESHILTTERGHAVEAGVMRFTKINPKARILFLSATMPNVNELGEWLTKLNGKETTVIYSTWRPVKLNINMIEFEIALTQYGRPDYWGTQENKKTAAINAILNKPDEKFLVFCHDKNTGKSMVKLLKDEGIEAKFHNADLNLTDRKEMETSFKNRNNGLRVMVSTSTTAWGVNLPARNVIIVGTTRGIQPVDELDIIQMSGRAGRYGIDDAGFVYLVIEQGTTAQWENVFVNPRPVLSTLNKQEILAFHTLSEIETREITSVTTMLNWYKRSLAYMQMKSGKYQINSMPFDLEQAENLIYELKEMEMITVNGGNPFVTGLGRTSAWMYYSPYDISAWYKNFETYLNMDKKDDKVLAWAIGDVPSKNMGYLPKDIKNECENLQWDLRNQGIKSTMAIYNAIAAHNCLTGENHKSGAINSAKRTLMFDINRITQALKLMDKMYTKWGCELFDSLPARIKYGVSEEIVPLTKLPKIGGVRAINLYNAGFTTLKEIANAKKEDLAKALKNPSLATSTIKNAKNMVKWG